MTKNLLCLSVLVLFVGNLAAAADRRLVEAARNQDREAAFALLKQNVDVNVAQADGATALHWAAHWNDVPLADALLRAGATVDAATDLGVTPLAVACGDGTADMVRRLLQSGADSSAVSLGSSATVTMANSNPMV